MSDQEPRNYDASEAPDRLTSSETWAWTQGADHGWRDGYAAAKAEQAPVTKLSDAQRRVLTDIRDHGDPGWSTHGLSAHGGLPQVIAALQRKGLMHELAITDKGLAALEAEQ